MRAGSGETGDPLPFAIDPALAPAIGAQGERRRHARALAKWWRARGNRFPRLVDGLSDGETGGDTATVLIELTDEGARVAHVGARLDRQHVWPDLLLDQILARAPIVRAQRTPLGFEADAWDGGAATVLRGILLPLADEDGMLRYVQAVLSWKAIAPQSGALAAAFACAEATAGADRPVSWQARPSNALPAERLAVARTWAALAAADPLSRRSSLDAALSAVFDAVLGGADNAIDSVFEAFSSSERRRLQLTLSHAMRLGLGAGTLAPLIARYPGGCAAIARLEIRIRKAERVAASAHDDRPAALQMRLVPIARDWMDEERRRADREIAEGTPWSDRRACAA